MTATPCQQVRRSQEDRRAESDRRILGAAMRLISRNGAAGTALAEIGVAAGYSRGLPSERFGTKQALLLSLIGKTEEAFEAQVMTDVGDRTGLSAVEARIEAHLNGAARSPDGVRALYLLYMESLTVAPELHSRIVKLGRTYRDGFIRHLREAQEAGEIRGDIDLRDYAIAILGMLRGTLTLWVIDPSAVDLEASRRTLVSMVRRALAPSAPPARTATTRTGRARRAVR